MSLLIRFRSIAEEEVAAIAVQYESDLQGLGSRFLHEVDRALSNISEFPFMYQLIDTDIRRAVMSHFPYVFFYTVDGENIIILGFRHMHQNPESWPMV